MLPDEEKQRHQHRAPDTNFLIVHGAVPLSRCYVALVLALALDLVVCVTKCRVKFSCRADFGERNGRNPIVSVTPHGILYGDATDHARPKVYESM